MGVGMRPVCAVAILCTTILLQSCSLVQDDWPSEGEIHRVLDLRPPYVVTWDFELDGGSSGGVIIDSQGKNLPYSSDGHTQTLYLGASSWSAEGARAVPHGDKKERAVAAILRLYASNYFSVSENAELERVWRTGGPGNLDASSWIREKRYACGMLRIAFDIEERLSRE